MALSLNPWWLLALVAPILLGGEWLQRRVAVLGRFNIPPPVVGGFLFSLLVLAFNVSGLGTLAIGNKVDAGWWTWLVTSETEWAARPEKTVHLPFLVGFFTCVGLNATWLVVRRGSHQLLVFWVISAGLVLAQNLLGTALARLLGETPLLGLICGSVTLAGGHGTALGFAGTLEQAGFPAAATVGAAAATFGLVAGSLIGGPVATRLIRRHRLAEKTDAGAPAPTGDHAVTDEAATPNGLLDQLRALWRGGRSTLAHLLMLAAVIKLGAWLSWALQQAGLVFPAYMGAMLTGVALRNVLDLAGWRVIDSRTMDLIGSLFLGVFLAIAMGGLNLIELASAAGPMLVILVAQTAFVMWFATWVVFRLMGRDYEAAVMAAGLCGFGLGATPNAVANMDTLARRFGPAPRAFIIVPAVGGLLMDFPNAFAITSFINLLK
jgi:ESS family glutamate:Na+ symporter